MRATYARPFGERKISAKLFFAIVWAGENSRRSFFLPWFRGTLPAWGMLGVRDVRPACVGTLTGGRKRQSASERCGGGVAPRGVRYPSPASYFFGCFQVRSNSRLYLPPSDARRQLSPGEGAAVCRIASPTAMAAGLAPV